MYYDQSWFETKLINCLIIATPKSKPLLQDVALSIVVES